jgi:hypothetical protein
MAQLISILGSITILAAYGASQFRLISSASLLYSVLNLVGSVVLSVIAFIERQWGFLLLEGVWALISLWTTIRMAAGAQESELPGAHEG